MTMAHVMLAPREATVLWDGDAVVLGASLAGVSIALGLARRGLRTCLVEAGPTLGTEVSQMWMSHLPAGTLGQRVLELCATRNACRGNQVDLLVATLAFDRLLEEAGVGALVRLQPARPLLDAKGRLLGVEVVGKSGRQAVRAPVVVDATPTRWFSRRALARPAARVLTAERRLYVYGAELEVGGLEIATPAGLGLAGNTVSARPAIWPGEAILTFRIALEAGVPTSGAQQRTSEAASGVMEVFRTCDPRHAACVLVDVSPACRIVAAADEPDFDELRDTGLYPLAGAADLADELASADRVAKTLTTPRSPVRFPGVRVAIDATQFITAELAAAPDRGLPRMRLPEAAAALHAERDVVVAGCGPGGSYAALAAAESRASVTVLDAALQPGGIGTAGRIHLYWYGLGGGLQTGSDQAVDATASVLGSVARGFHPVGKAQALSRSLAALGVESLMGQVVFGVIKEGDRVKAVLAADQDGYHVFPCTVAIDATGDGDVAAAAGAAFSIGRAGDGFPQPYSYTPSFIENGKLTFANYDVGWLDPTDALDFSRAHFEGRRRIWDQGPFSQERHYLTLAPQLGVRESRLVRGGITLTLDDFLDGCTYADTVCEGYAHYDNHALDYALESAWAWRYVVMCGLWGHFCRGHVPYRVLVPEGVDGLLVAGRAISVDHDLHQLLRMQRDMQKIGEVCGVAAAMALQAGVLPSRLDVRELRRRLGQRGVLPEHAPAAALGSAPAAELLGLLGTDQNALATWRLSRLPQDQAPDWDAFFAAERDTGRRFCAAVAAVLGGARQAAARATLQQAIREQLDGPRIGHNAPPRSVVAALALAAIQEPDSVDRLGEMLLAWKERTFDVPVLLLLLQAIGQVRDRRGVDHVKAFLAQTETEGFPFALAGNWREWAVPLRFAVVLRAVRTLLELGCADACDRLAPYVNDENLLIRNYARRVSRMERP